MPSVRPAECSSLWPISTGVSCRQARPTAGRCCCPCRTTAAAVGGDSSGTDSNSRPSSSSSRHRQPAPKIRGQSRGVPLIAVDVKTRGAQEEVRCLSGTSLLRDVMLENLYSIELFDKWGKVWQCGGSGKCGACMVKVLKGNELLSDRTEIEDQWLQHQGHNCRLTCQAWVGNGDNSGDIEVSLDI